MRLTELSESGGDLIIHSCFTLLAASSEIYVLVPGPMLVL
jgi:hypothetical protein